MVRLHTWVKKSLVVSAVCFSAGFAYSQNNTAGETPAQSQFSHAEDYVKRGWSLIGSNKPDDAIEAMDACMAQFGAQADVQAVGMKMFPPEGTENSFKLVNDVATCAFIKAEAMRDKGNTNQDEALLTQTIEWLQKNIIARFPFAVAFDARGWRWALAETADKVIHQIKTGEVKDEQEGTVIISQAQLADEGTEFPVNYASYGTFANLDTSTYKYTITDPVGLARAVGEGISPNTRALKEDPEYQKIRKELQSMDHWKKLNSRDMNAAFYKWNIAPEPENVRQFYIAEILERSGRVKQAIKAYYALVVHFPHTIAWTYWHTPWYPAKAAIYRIRYLLKENPELGYSLEGAYVRVLNDFDADIKNDQFIVNPGKFVPVSASGAHKGPRSFGKPIETRGGDTVKLVKFESGDWQMFVNNKPFMIKGVTYDPTRVGESPDKGTLENWTRQDSNKNGSIDSPFEAWVDANRDNFQDEHETVVGDFALMRDMGVNCIRLYQKPYDTDKNILNNKEVLRALFDQYGIYVMMGDFLGKYAIGSGATWEQGTDYDNPEQKVKMLEHVKAMVLEFRDEPYILGWLLGNENVYGLGCNADKKPASFFAFANEAALLIKSLDHLKRPVGIASGDALYLDIFGSNCPDIDIYGTNAYRGKYGFLDLWDEIKGTADKPAMITEYGAPSYAKNYSQDEAEEFQAEYHKNAWLDIAGNSAGFGAGNAVGGFAFEWMDEWWKAYEPYYHDKKGLWTGPFLDGYMHEEWLGIVGQGNGRHSPFLRELKKAYFAYQKVWTGEAKK